MRAKNVIAGFPIVCVGGSAGSLDAYIRLLRHLPAEMGVAIVFVNHVRNFATLLHEILPYYTTMPVELITERLLIQPIMCISYRNSATCTFSMMNSASNRYQSQGGGLM